jgi:lysophospholipase L1-like esterase
MSGFRPILYWFRFAVFALSAFVVCGACVLLLALGVANLRLAMSDPRRAAAMLVPDPRPDRPVSIPRAKAVSADGLPAPAEPAPSFAGPRTAALTPVADRTAGNEALEADEAALAGTVGVSPRAARRNAPGASLTILQIGDSHTSADFLTGALRRRLQQRYGNGGPGYITAGRPHIGVLSSTVKINVSPNWTYQAIQKSDNVEAFWLSGFNAVASAPGEALTFAANAPMTFDSIEIEVVRQPGGGAIDIVMDGAVKKSYDLNGEKVEPVVLRLLPSGGPTDHVRQLEIRTRTGGSVSIASVAIYNRQSGVSYNSIGYPGATVDLLNKFDQALLADDLRRINPQIVVLSFGTNEAFKRNLDLARYAQNYEKAIDRIKAVLPAAEIVLIGPPDGDERAPHCPGKSAEAACRPGVLEAPPPSPAAGAAPPKPADCDWHPLPKLEAVRDVQRQIAERRGFAFWNWASIMPGECAAHRWVRASPALMEPDHVHFTVSGYNKSADGLLDTLIPVIERLRTRTAAN